MQAVEYRNVVVLGKTGAGKSTVANKISGLTKFEVKNVAGTGTTNVEEANSIHYDKDSAIHYHFKVIDTVGVFDRERKNDGIINEIKEFFQNNAPEGVNLVLFVFRRGRFTEEEKRTFDFITQNFRKQISDFSALAITNCDGESEVARDEFLQSFKSEAPAVARFMKKGIYMVGFPDVSKLRPGVRKALEEDMEDEIKMLQKIVKNADKRCLAKEMFERSFWEKLKDCIIL